jgi:hypothetical protein
MFVLVWFVLFGGVTGTTIFDKHSNRLGYYKKKQGRIVIYDKHWNRLGHIRTEPIVKWKKKSVGGRHGKK